MFAPPPIVNLIVIRSEDIEMAEKFYSNLGMLFCKEKHGTGPEHYAYCANGLVFEIYPLKENDHPTTNVRLGFDIDSVDDYINDISTLGGVVVTPPHDSEWGRRTVIKDPDGHTIELVCKNGT